MPKRTATMAEETLRLRLRMHALMEGGMSEADALVEILPTDSNRRRKFNRWKDKGLFPPTATELAEPSVPDTASIPHPHAPEPIRAVLDTATVPHEETLGLTDAAESELPEQAAQGAVGNTGVIPHQTSPGGHDTAKIPQRNDPGARKVAEKQLTEPSEPVAVSDTAGIPLTLSPQDFGILRRIIDESKAADVPAFAALPRQIPEISPPKGPGTSLRLRPDFLDAAMKRAAELYPDQRLTITRLLNWLLMSFAGIETDPELREASPQARDEGEGT